MCTINDAISVAAGIFEVIGTIGNNNIQNAKSNYSIEVLNQQAEKAIQEAAIERQEGIEESRRKKLQSILNMGKEASKFAAGNIALSSQTAVNAVDDIKSKGELDALNTLKISEKRAEYYESRAKQYYQNAALTAFNAKLNSKNTLFSIGSKLLNYGQSAYKRNENFINERFTRFKNAELS